MKKTLKRLGSLILCGALAVSLLAGNGAHSRHTATAAHTTRTKKNQSPALCALFFFTVTTFFMLSSCKLMVANDFFLCSACRLSHSQN